MNIREASLLNQDDFSFIFNMSLDAFYHSIPEGKKTVSKDLFTYGYNLTYLFLNSILYGKDDYFCLIGEEQNIMVSFIIVAIRKDVFSNELQGWVMAIGVEENHRGKGYGKQILTYAENAIRNRGIPFIGLAVTSSNLRAVNLYEKMGYIEERKLMGKSLEDGM